MTNRQRIRAGEAYRALRKLQQEPMAAKIKRAHKIVAAARRLGRTVVSFSGGRDSVALAIIAQEIDPAIPLVYVDTGIADPRLTEFVCQWAGDRLIHLHSDTHPETTWRNGGPVPIGAKVSAANYRRDNPELRINPSACCHVHKAAPMDRYRAATSTVALLIGARGDDSHRHRFKLQSGEIIPQAKGYFAAYPLLTWTRDDVFAFMDERLPNYQLRYGAAEEYGCRACCIDLPLWPNQLALLRHSDPAYHRRLIVEVGFGVQILMIRYGLTEAGARQLIDRDGWGALIDAGAFDRIPQPKAGKR